MGKKVCIVFEETGQTPEGMSFNCYLEGLSKERMRLSPEQLTAAEFWAVRAFGIVSRLLQETGAARELKTRQ